MSPSSSSSWDGAGADIIDLDRYMRGNVRPSRKFIQETQQCSELLVVDGGGIGKMKVDSSNAWQKRYSHDSGVSDGSYVQRRAHRPHRRATHSISDGAGSTPRARVPASVRTLGGGGAQGHSSSSLHAFRTICEQALLDQQKQIARVAQICERLTERADKERLIEGNTERPLEQSCINERLAGKAVSERSGERLSLDNNQPADRVRRERCKRIERPKQVGKNRIPPESSDISSSSRSTTDSRRKQTRLVQECKTYKIIMSKLDELNHRFCANTRPGAREGAARRMVPPPPQTEPPHPRTTSSSFVTVSDKLVATDIERTGRMVMPIAKSIFCRESRKAPSLSVSAARSPRPHVVAHACSVDIAPEHAAQKSPRVATESVIKCESSCGSSAAGDPRCGFHLDDPVHLYSQAMRLRTLPTTIRRARSASVRAAHTLPACADADERSSERSGRTPSLCSLCRGYWRSLRQYFVGPINDGS